MLDSVDVIPVIDSVIASSEFIDEFSVEEQNNILLMFAIFLDSQLYWSENLYEWSEILALITDDENQGDTKGWWDSFWRNRGKIWAKVKQLARADANGVNWTEVGQNTTVGAGAGAYGGTIGSAAAGALIGGGTTVVYQAGNASILEAMNIVYQYNLNH